MGEKITEYRYKRIFGESLYELCEDSIKFSGKNDSGSDMNVSIPLKSLRIPGGTVRMKAEIRQFLQALPALVAFILVVVSGDKLNGYSPILFWILLFLSVIAMFPLYYYCPKHRIQVYVNDYSGNTEFGVMESLKNTESYEKFIDQLEKQIELSKHQPAISVHSLETNEFEPNRTTVYKKVGNTALKLHIFIPPDHKSSDARPAIVFFFGGGWNSGTPSQFYPHCEYLASRGMVAMAADYRVKSRDNTTPRECVEDGKSAIRWVREHHQQLGIDPDQVLAGGGSAGGQVAAAAGTTDGFEGGEENLKVSSRPVALVLFNPVFDNGPTGYGHEQVRDYWQNFSPMHTISKTTPPTIVFLGCNDNLIPVATAEEYKRRMEDNGRRCDLHLYEGQPHGFFNYRNREFFDQTVREMDRFLVSLGFLESQTQNKSQAATATSPAP